MLAFFEAGSIPLPDILLASELDRGCSRSGSRDVSRDFAERLGYNFVFGVEFIELPREGGAGGRILETCEHGNAIFSRFPLGNVDVRFHRDNKDWYLPPDQRTDGEPRLGGRSFVLADADLGDGNFLRLISVHFESNPVDIEFQLSQAAEVADLGAQAPIPAIVAGDTNNVSYFIDVSSGRDDTPDRVIDRTVRLFLDRGFVDPHRVLGTRQRPTRGGFVIDLIFSTEDRWSAPAVCPPTLCTREVSDHQAVWATYTLP
jgi:endonuclease/exonuclease/phosphatase family metal-dependent hydrolase